MKRLLRKILPWMALFPLVTGTIGYLIPGGRFTDALYAGFALYFTNPVSDEYNIYVEIARWTAPLVTATTILCALQSVWQKLKCRLHLLGKKDKVAVYSDILSEISFEEGVSAIYPGEKFKSYADSHMILFSTDKKNLQFYEEHREELADKKVYLGIRDIDSGLLNSIKGVTIFDVNSAIARSLWKKIALWKQGDSEEYHVVIWGDSKLAGDIVCTGLQMNLFSLKQKVTYHIITGNKWFESRHSEMKLMNEDELIFYDKKDFEAWNVISGSDLIIVADDLEAEVLQTVIVKSAGVPVYYYSPEEGDLASYIAYGNLIPFGRRAQVFTDENIRRRKLIWKAIALNEYYADQYGAEKDWELLTGFLKDSNISASDFGEVLSFLSKEKPKEELAKLEHIRWCRFHYLNYYTAGIPVNGKNRDDSKRIHKDLVDYDELDPAEQRKDMEAIRITQKL